MNVLARNAGGLWIAVGVALGTALGLAVGYASIGLALGAVAGVVAGFRCAASGNATGRTSCIVSPGFFFVLCLAASATFIAATTHALPEQVASHFGSGNAANGFMTRGGYSAFMLAFGLRAPAFMAIVVGPCRAGADPINVPNRDYWLDPKRWEATMGALSALGAWLGSLTTIFIAAIHYVLIVANETSPPQLPADLFRMLLIGFVVGIALWLGTLYLRFRNIG
jgi:hypothetical protein